MSSRSDLCPIVDVVELLDVKVLVDEVVDVMESRCRPRLPAEPLTMLLDVC